MKKIRLSLVVLLGVIASFAGSILLSPSANASHTAAGTLTVLTVGGAGGDQFYNYDFGTPSAASDNIDWPLTLVYQNNATVDQELLHQLRGLVRISLR